MILPRVTGADSADSTPSQIHPLDFRSTCSRRPCVSLAESPMTVLTPSCSASRRHSSTLRFRFYPLYHITITLIFSGTPDIASFGHISVLLCPIPALPPSNKLCSRSPCDLNTCCKKVSGAANHHIWVWIQSQVNVPTIPATPLFPHGV